MATTSAPRKRLIVPTAQNVLNAVSDNIVQNFRQLQDADLELPNLYRLAHQVVNNTGEMVLEYDESDVNSEDEE